MKRIAIILTLLLFPTSLLAQTTEAAAVPWMLEGASFFVCIIAGVLLAIGFQLLLTAISVAGGITAIGNIKEKANSPSSSSSKDDDDDGMNVGQKISTGLGAWTMITTSIALFFASLLAVKLGLIGANFIGATLGLVIWAAFFMTITYLEMTAISSLVGGLASTVKNSLSSASSVFAKSEESKSKAVAKTEAKEQAKQMRKQFEKLFDTNDVDKKIDDYIQKLEPQRIDVNKIKKELKDLITDLQVTEKADFDYPNSVKKMVLEEADKSTLSKEDKQAIKEHVGSLKDIAQKDASNQEKAKQGIEELTPADRQQIDKYQEEITKALKNTNNRELQPDKLEQDLKRILDNPKDATDIAKAKASAMDRNTLVKILASQNMTEQEADKRVSQAEKVLNKVSSFFGESQKKSEGKQAEMQQKAEGKKAELEHKASDLQAKVKAMFAGGTSDLNRIYSDFTNIFQSSGSGPDLQYKLKHYDRAEMTAMITNKTSLSRAEAEKISDKIVSARDQVLAKANEVERKVNEKMEEAKQKSLTAAEESRKAAATAAWWFVATAILSGVASAVGGMLALESWFF